MSDTKLFDDARANAHQHAADLGVGPTAEVDPLVLTFRRLNKLAVRGAKDATLLDLATIKNLLLEKAIHDYQRGDADALQNAVDTLGINCDECSQCRTPDPEVGQLCQGCHDDGFSDNEQKASEVARANAEADDDEDLDWATEQRYERIRQEGE